MTTTFSVLLSQKAGTHAPRGLTKKAKDGRRRIEGVRRNPVLERLHVGFYVVWYNEIYITFIFFDDTHTFDFCKFYENANMYNSVGADLNTFVLFEEVSGTVPSDQKRISYFCCTGILRKILARFGIYKLSKKILFLYKLGLKLTVIAVKFNKI